MSAPSAPAPTPSDEQPGPSQPSQASDAELRAYIESLTDEQRQQLAGELWEAKLKETKVKVNGKKMSLWKLREQVCTRWCIAF